MKRELLRVYKNKGILIAISLVLIILIIFACNYVTELSSINKLRTPYYENFDEINERIIELKEAIKNLDSKQYDYSYKLDEYQTLLTFYQFVFDNQIEHADLTQNYQSDKANIYFNSSDSNTPDDRVAYILTILPTSLIFIMGFVILLCAFLVNYDFTTGVYKLLYAHNNNRAKIFLRKFLACLTVTSVVYALVSVFVAISSSLFEVNFTIIIVTESSSAYIVNSNAYIFIEYLTSFTVLMFITLIFFSISVMIRNMYLAILINVIIGIGYYLAYSSESVILNFAFAELINCVDAFVPVWVFIISILLRYTLALGMVYGSKRLLLARQF
ncbi:MAG: hypothetical protein LBE09_05740 [Christensenellaceae bacterium]|jgi:ABC-type transport system involved in multi-copper enzyme maturation permease subunit|nr:hypothetical protein [Christensenellaceae bacterium]